jgi:D-sedoheptulose 7-phosphate isomerase
MGDGDSARHVEESIREYADLAADLATSAFVRAVADVADVLVATYRAGGRLVLFGNGGSASDASHIAAEFVGRCTRDRRALPALSLSDNGAAVTSIANDFGFAHVFARQVEAFVAPGDVAMGLTTSGRSENVLAGLALARSCGAITVALCGEDDQRLRGAVDHCLAVPSSRTPRVQEVHVLWGHVWSELVEQSLSDT